ncbi:MAG: hypothetical protein K9J42_15245 [Sulfuritalea sp.]|nr:hypothetical protein [Sulfuritalea sp.]
MKFSTLTVAALLLVALTDVAVAQSAADYRRMEVDAVRQMQAAKNRDDQAIWRSKAEFYRDQASKLESGAFAGKKGSPSLPPGKSPLLAPGTGARPPSNPAHPNMPATNKGKNNVVRMQEAPSCPPGKVTYGDGCKLPSEICHTPQGVGLIMNGRCQIGAR